jgi:glycosyltransferase involved in cell wall biosynthesis
MNVLMVSTRPPVPVTKGDQVVLRNRIRELRLRGHRLFLCFVHSSNAEVEGIEEIGRDCVAIYPHRLTILRQAMNLVCHGIFSATPLQVALFRDARFASLISDVVRREKIDVINSFLIRPFLSVESQPVPLIVDLIDSMLLNARRRIPAAPLWMRPVLHLEALRLARYERYVCSRAASSLVVADVDREHIDGERLFVNPLGVDGSEFYPCADGYVRRRIVFSGNMEYHANKTALRWFVGSCWLAVHDEFPDAELCVAGSGSERLASAYGHAPGIRFIGRVRSMGDFLRTADVSIAPMQSGSGMQNKVLEAMACGVPTVVTRLGLGDIQAADGTHTLVADDCVAFTGAIRRLFMDQYLHRALAGAAAELVKTRYSWASNAAEFERIALECIFSNAASAGAARVAA